MTYSVEIGSVVGRISAANAVEAIEKGIDLYNEEYVIQADDWFTSGGEEDAKFASEIASIDHVDGMRMDLVDAETRGKRFARYVGTDQAGRIATATATLIED